MKIGLIGINNLKQEDHFKIIKQALNKNLYGIFSHSDDILAISTKYNIKLYDSATVLFENVEAVYFAQALKPNYDFAISALKKSCHLFIEDVSNLTIDEIKHLYKVAFEARTKIQLKLTKAFTPEYIEIRDYLKDTKLIEINKTYSKFLRHDDYFTEILNNLYFAYQNINSGIKKISTLALPIDHNHFSLIQIRLDYDNGAVVNMNFSNISDENKSVADFYEKDRMIQVDFNDHFAVKQRFSEGQIVRREFNIPKETAFNTEMMNFITSCKNLDLQNISESPKELKLIQVTNDIMDRLIQSTHPR